MKFRDKLIERIKTINTNILVAGSALFVSVCALFISTQEVRIMRTQQKATMYPYVTIGWTYAGKGFGVQIKNSGNGLAKVHSYKVYNDSIYFKEWFDVVSTLTPEVKNIDYSLISTSGNIRNEMIGPGETKTLIFLKWTPETRFLEKKIRDIKVSVCYSSLLNEYWLIEDGAPNQIDSECELNKNEEFDI
ncbi:hypothetical protein [Flagellimonas sp. 2504JD1-5]